MFYDSDININIGLLRLSPKHQLVHKEKKSPYALSVSHHNRKGALHHRPTQGWTVDEANLLCKVIYILWPSSLGLDGEYIQPTHPWKQNEACTWAFLLLISNNKRERCMPHGNYIAIMQFYVGIIAYSRDCRLILRIQYLSIRGYAFWGCPRLLFGEFYRNLSRFLLGQGIVVPCIEDTKQLSLF